MQYFQPSKIKPVSDDEYIYDKYIYERPDLVECYVDKPVTDEAKLDKIVGKVDLDDASTLNIGSTVKNIYRQKMTIISQDLTKVFL